MRVSLFALAALGVALWAVLDWGGFSDVWGRRAEVVAVVSVPAFVWRVLRERGATRRA